MSTSGVVVSKKLRRLSTVGRRLKKRPSTRVASLKENKVSPRSILSPKLLADFVMHYTPKLRLYEPPKNSLRYASVPLA